MRVPRRGVAGVRPPVVVRARQAFRPIPTSQAPNASGLRRRSSESIAVTTASCAASAAPCAPTMRRQLRTQHGVVALDQRGERVAVAAAGAADEIGIGRHLYEVVRRRARGVTRGISTSVATAPTSTSAAPRLSR